jgi:hypothetical protein
MKLFRCDHCGHTLYFENVACQNCGHRLGYVPEIGDVVSLDSDEVTWSSPKIPGKKYLFCANAAQGACNWLIESQPRGEVFCRACRHNETIPPLSEPQHLSQWQTIERAKHRLIYSILQFGLPLETRTENPRHGLSFRFLADLEPQPIMTGHDEGIVTIALAEADDAERERRRTSMHEPYRTLLGHFRHEIGHHYWDLLVAGGPMHEEFRILFGDETIDYEEALRTYYLNGAPPDWQHNFISAYATAHAWEDFAETWAHFLHLTDTAEIAASYGLKLNPDFDDTGQLAADIRFDAYRIRNISTLVDNWVPLASLLNNLNRSMGLSDAYPFVLTPKIVEKLGFILRLVHQPQLQREPALT